MMQRRNSYALRTSPSTQRRQLPASPRPAQRRSQHEPLKVMPEWQKHILRVNSILMKKTIRFEDCMILDYLFEKKVLTDANFDALTNMAQAPHAQVHKFIKILECKGEAAYYDFLDSLKQDESYGYIWQKLVDDGAKYDRSCGPTEADSSYTIHVSTKSSDEQLYIDERGNTYIVSVPTCVPVVTESKISDLKSRLWELHRPIMSAESGYEELPEYPIQVNEVTSTEAALQPSTTAVQDFLKTYCEPKEVQVEQTEQLLLETDLTDLLRDIFNSGEWGLAYNAHRNLLVVQFCNLKAYGDISKEMWFYPSPVSSKQITEWLSLTRLQGCFYVYKSSNTHTHGPDYAPYNIGLCHNESGEVIHYRIVQNSNNELQIGDVRNNRGMKFDSIQNLVKYFRGTRGCLECRLRWSPRELTEKQPLDCTIPVDQLEFQDRIASQSDRNHTSEVFKGVYSGHKVAIKKQAKLPQNKLEEDNFLMEARILGELSHNNITKFKGICYLKEACHLIFEYADNSDLHSCLRKGLIDCANIRTSLGLWMQLLDALWYMKAQKFIIHRDIAARNCLIHDLVILKLSDFGMAAKVEQHDEFIPDKDDSFSYRWAAPEVFIQRCFSTMSDIWSAGVVFWEMATGAKDIPYKDLKENRKVERKITNGRKLVYSDDMEKEYEVPMKEIVAKCWRKESKERPTAKELLQSCNKYMNTLDGGDNLYDNVGPSATEKSHFVRRMSDRLKDKFKTKKK